MSFLEALSAVPKAELSLGLFLACLSGMLVRSMAGVGDGRGSRGFRHLLRDEHATATLDFTLVFPIFTMVILVLAQLSLLINARLVVSYAAFAATRSAVVWLEDGGEAVARERAEKAAEVGCSAISPADQVLGLGWLNALPVAPLYVHALDGDFVRRVIRGGSKFDYSKLATTARLRLPDGELGAHDPVTVEVEHLFYLSVPYGDRLFRDPGTGLFGLPIRTIRDEYTLTNEGRVQSR